MRNTTKVHRFVNAIVKDSPKTRKGHCTPETCENLSGGKGAACCHLEFKCPLLKHQSCKIYKIRPLNCRIFPRQKADLELVRNCGYYFV